MATQSNTPKRKDQPMREGGKPGQGERKQPGAPDGAGERVREAQGDEAPQPRPKTRK